MNHNEEKKDLFKCLVSMSEYSFMQIQIKIQICWIYLCFT